MNNLEMLNSNSLPIQGAYDLTETVSFQITDETIEDWIHYLDRSENTKETYRRNFRSYRNYLEVMNVQAPTRDSIKAFRESMLKDHEDTTVYAYINAIKSFFRWTGITGIYPNIADGIQGGKIEQCFRHDPLTIEEAVHLMDQADRSTEKGKRDYAIIVLMLTSGLRTVEVIRADIGDMRTVMGERVLFIQGKGKSGKNDYVKLSEHAEKAIADYLESRTSPKGLKAPLFASVARRNPGERMTTRALRKIIGDLLDKAELHSDRITPHSLRHTSATVNIQQGGTLEETQQLLRHSKIETTRIYTHITSRSDNQSENRLDTALFRKGVQSC